MRSNINISSQEPDNQRQLSPNFSSRINLSLQLLFLPLIQRSRTRVARNWISNANKNKEDLLYLLSKFENSRNKLRKQFSIIKSWSVQAERGFADLSQLFLDNQNPENNLFANNLELREFVNVEQNRFLILHSWLINNKRNAVDFAKTLKIINLAHKKTALTLVWMQNYHICFDDLKSVIENIETDEDKLIVLKISIELKALFSGEFLSILSLIEKEQFKEQIISKWMRYSIRPIDTLESFVDSVDEKNNKSLIVINWILAKVNNSKIEASQFKQALGFIEKKFELTDDQVLDYFTQIFPLINNEIDKSQIIKSWIETSNNLNLNQLAKALTIFDSSTYLNNKLQKIVILKLGLEKLGFFQNPSPEIYSLKYKKDLVETLKTVLRSEVLGILIFQSYEVATFLKKYSFPKEKLLEITTSIYPNNELLQVELIQEWIRQNKNSQNILEDFVQETLKPFVLSLKNNDLAFLIIRYANENNLNLSNLEVLELASSRFKRNYESVKDLLQNKPLLQSLTIEGAKTISNLFGENSNAILENKNLADLFSYYDINNDFVTFKWLLKAEIFDEILQNFKPNEKFVYFSREEYAKLQQLLNTEESSFELPLVAELTNYLKPKITNIESYLSNSNNLINFEFGKSDLIVSFFNSEIEIKEETKEEDLDNLTESKTDESEESLAKNTISYQEYINQESEKFRNLLHNEVIDKDSLADFFEKILRLESRINDINRQKLKDFFDANKNQIVNLFMKENGIDKFAKIMVSLEDGCVANIATQFRNAFYQEFLTDESDQVLMAVFNENINVPILNFGGDNLTGSALGVNPLELAIINESAICPCGIAKKIAEEFFYNKEKIRDCWAFFNKFVSESFRNELFEKLNEAYPENLEQSASIFASYLILKNYLPQILENKFLTQFENFNLEIINSVNEELAKESDNQIPDTNLKGNIAVSNMLKPNQQEATIEFL